jgi:hypothetical protein
MSRFLLQQGRKENLAVRLRGRNAPFPDDRAEICYVALGATAAKIELHLDDQRKSTMGRHWICDPTDPRGLTAGTGLWSPGRMTTTHRRRSA